MVSCYVYCVCGEEQHITGATLCVSLTSTYYTDETISRHTAGCLVGTWGLCIETPFAQPDAGREARVMGEVGVGEGLRLPLSSEEEGYS